MIKIISIVLLLILLSGVASFNFVFAENVPQWVKNTAKWYGEDKISETEFLNAIRFLVNNGIINLEESKNQTSVSSSASTQELVEQGIEQLSATNNLAALDFFNRVLQKDPNNIKALADKGIVLARQGNYKDAKSVFDKAIELSEKNGNVDYRIVANAGIVLSIYGDPDLAHVYFDRVLEHKDIVRQETLVAVLVNKGVTIFEQGRYEESLKYFDEALLIEPDRVGALVNKANALQELKRTNEAYDLFKKAHQLSNDPLSWKPKFIIIQ